MTVMKPKILFISVFPPYPLTSGDNIRVYNLLAALSRFSEVFLISFCRDPSYPADEAKKHLESFCQSVWFIRNNIFKNPILNNIVSIPHIKAISELWFGISNLWFCHPEASAIIKQLIQDSNINVVWFEKTFTTHYIKNILGKDIKTIMGTQNFESDVTYQKSKFDRSPIWKIIWLYKWINELIYERKYTQLVNKIVVVSENDARFYRQLVDSSKIEIIPNFIDVKDYAGGEAEKEDAICFTGSMSYFPNIDAITYFVEEVWQKIKKKHNNVKLYVVGKNPTENIKRLDSDDIIITGLVESTVPFLKKSKLSIVPLRYGSGTRLKILESMACGTPVISTSLGCEGLDVTNGENIIIADTPDDFAQAVIQLLEYPGLRQSIGEIGEKFVERTYSLEANTAKLERLISDLITN